MTKEETTREFLKNSGEAVWDAAIILTRGEPDTVQEQEDLEAAAKVIQEEFTRHFGTALTDIIALNKTARVVLQLALDQGIRPFDMTMTMVKVRRRLSSSKRSSNDGGGPDMLAVEKIPKKLRRDFEDQ